MLVVLCLNISLNFSQLLFPFMSVSYQTGFELFERPPLFSTTSSHFLVMVEAILIDVNYIAQGSF
jgi:hypothetical protein